MQYDELDEDIQMMQSVYGADVIDRYLPSITNAPTFASAEHASVQVPSNNVVHGLTIGEWKTRVAAHVLGQQGDHAAIASLTDMLDDPSTPVRVAVIEALGAFSLKTVPSIPALDAIIKALNDSAWEVREVAAFTLGQLGSHIPVAPLLEALNDSDASVRATVVRTLGNVGVCSPLQVIVVALNDESGVVREAAVGVLSQQSRRTPVVALMGALYDEVTCVHLSARRGLAGLEATPLTKSVFAAYEIADEAQPVATQAFNICTDLALAILKKQASVEPIHIILEEMQGQDYRAVKSYLLARALNELNESTPLEPLLPLLQSNNTTERINGWRMIMLLAQTMLRWQVQVGVLASAAREEERMVREEAEQAIIELVDLALKVLSERMETTHLLTALQGEDRFAAEEAMWFLVGQAFKVLGESSPQELERQLANFERHESSKRAAAGRRLAQQARDAIAERRSPSVPAIISWQNSHQTAPIELQLGSSLPGQSSKTHTVLPWREIWMPIHEEKPRLAIFSQKQRKQFAAQWN